MRLISLLTVYVKRAFLEWTAFRSLLFTLVVNQTVTPLLGLAVWSAALPGRPAISTYYVALLAVQLMTVSSEYYTITMIIYEGALNDDLLRPHPFVIRPLGQNIAERIWHLLLGLPVIVIAALLVGVSFHFEDILVAVPAVVFAGLLRFLFVFTLALSALWTQQAGGVTEFGATLIFLLGGAAAPITLFPEGLRQFGEALPFRVMLGFPAEIASGSLSNAQILQGYGWQVFWIAVFIPLAAFVWRSGMRRYLAVGG